MVWNRTTHLWNSTEKVIHQRTNTVPFALGSHDEDISTTVRVIRPLDAAELDLETTYENFHPSAQSLSTVIGHFISGERPKGIHETEEMLRVGDSVTAVGELVLDNNLIKLQPPKAGLCYFLTRTDFESLLRKQVNGVRLWRILTVVFGLAACSTLLFVLWRRYVHNRQSRKERSMLEEFKEQQRRRMRELNLEESSVSPSSCTVCLSRQRSCVFLECGHVCACAECYESLTEPKKCPICRAPIERVVPLYTKVFVRAGDHSGSRGGEAGQEESGGSRRCHGGAAVSSQLKENQAGSSCSVPNSVLPSSTAVPSTRKQEDHLIKVREEEECGRRRGGGILLRGNCGKTRQQEGKDKHFPSWVESQEADNLPPSLLFTAAERPGLVLGADVPSLEAGFRWWLRVLSSI
ncbi:Mitochondrial ubiquitin ligase activator of NFKB 1 [Oryzias melastigma]|uniref:RING-type E3 ubiquitin transferase n=1 Tax=Oryzias melastigma TaxID=30732 RepID=A0A834FGJ6_ORYME|nr:Mitochondrial ubiquitin ligase activator of NFKB 1 [Oryzias melastigma]